MKKKILFVLSDNYPIDGACSNILNNIFKLSILNADNYEISVLTQKSFIEQPSVEIIENIKIYRLECYSFFGKKEIQRSLKMMRLHNTYSIIKERLKYKIQEKIDGEVFISDAISNCFFDALVKIGVNNYDVIISVVGLFNIIPAVDKYVKLCINTKHIIYQLDPCAENPCRSNHNLKSAKAFEFKYYNNADAIITTSIIKTLKEIEYPQFKNKFFSVEFPNITPSLSYSKISNDKQSINCSFTGTFYLGIRDPGYTIRIFRKLHLLYPKIRLNIVGVQNTDSITESVNEGIFYMKKIPLLEAKKMIANSDFLVNIGNKNLNQVPSKLFDYISSGKPIINFCKNKNCPTIQYLKDYPYKINLLEEESLFDSQVEKLITFIESNKNNTLSFSEIKRLYYHATPEYVGKYISEIIQNV